ncbi:MAG TPA: hypothetical protein VFV38_48560 [Ktedonobacteraceae bacterium]|nr:hypothetical protein [Ktedonobacteraceae bacterium]
MELFVSQTSNHVRGVPPGRRNLILTLYALLVWFVLILIGSLCGVFVQPPGIASLPTYLAAFGPAILFVIAYLLSAPFRQWVRVLIGDPWGIAAMQIYRVLGIAFVVEAFQHALPALFAFPAGWGDFFIGVTAPLAALAWSSGGRLGRAVFVVWNVLGMFDLFMAVSLAVVSSSISPGTLALRVFPLSLIPLFAVPLSLSLHFAGLGQFWSLSKKQTT